MSRKRTTRSETQRAVQEENVFDRARFTSIDSVSWLRKKEPGKFVVEKTVSREVDQEFQLSFAFNERHWRPILRLPKFYYPQLVKEFYANVADKNEKDLLSVTTFVKGKSISLDAGILAGILDVPNLGPLVHQRQKHFHSDPHWIKRVRMDALGIESTQLYKGDRRHFAILTRKIPIRLRLVAYLCQHNICPTRGNRNELRNIDFYIADKILHGLGEIEGIPVADLMIREMRGAVHKETREKTFIFPRVLSHVFKAFEVDVSGEEVVQVSKADYLTNYNMKHLGYRFGDGKWWLPGSPRVDYDQVWPKGSTPPRPQPSSSSHASLDPSPLLPPEPSTSTPGPSTVPPPPDSTALALLDVPSSSSAPPPTYEQLLQQFATMQQQMQALQDENRELRVEMSYIRSYSARQGDHPPPSPTCSPSPYSIPEQSSQESAYDSDTST